MSDPSRSSQHSSSIAFSERRSPLYLSEKSRFRGTFVEEEKKRRDEATKKQQWKLKKKQQLLGEIQAQRLQDERLMAERYRQRMDYLQQRGSPKNQSGVPYDPLTLEYDETVAGKQLEFEDKKTIYRARLRAKRLHFEQNRNGYNPITGEKAIETPIPKEPTPLG